MIVYHGSITEIRHPDIIHSKRFLDFGQGFYVTSYQKQAERWAIRKAMRSGKTPLVNVYELDDVFDDYSLLRFEEDNDEWLDFVCNCRKGIDTFKEYDIVIGGVANDDVFKTVDMYFRGVWDKEKTLKELRFFKKNDQIALISQKLIDDCLKFQRFYKVEVNG